MADAFSQAWAFLKADTRQVYQNRFHGPYHYPIGARQTMNHIIQAMADREYQKRYQENLKNHGLLAAEFTERPQVELSGEPRNRYNDLVIERNLRNWPTEGGPDNEPKHGTYGVYPNIKEQYYEDLNPESSHEYYYDDI